MISLSPCDTNNGKLFSVTYNSKEMSYDTIPIPNVKYNSDIKLNKEIEPGNWITDKIKMWETFFNTETGF